MGADFGPREVLRTTSGLDQLYTVGQTNGESYVVNSAHLLVLKRGKNGERCGWGKGGLRYPSDGGVHYVTARELAAKSKKFREVFVGYRAGC